tara:strand:+ start:1420 stop:1737 length:318 start_codon:yes stop_codon:yes gene_type:complete
MTEKTLSTGKKVVIRKLSRVEIRNIKDLGSQRLYPDGSMGYHGLNKVQDAWIDKGCGGLGDWVAKNGEVVPDDIIMQLDDKEQHELAELIKESQIVNPTNPSSSD